MFPLNVYNPIKFAMVLNIYTQSQLERAEPSHHDYEKKALKLYPFLLSNQLDDLVKEVYEFEHYCDTYASLNAVN